jgi:hypothetical protein
VTEYKYRIFNAVDALDAEKQINELGMKGFEIVEMSTTPNPYPVGSMGNKDSPIITVVMRKELDHEPKRYTRQSLAAFIEKGAGDPNWSMSKAQALYDIVRRNIRSEEDWEKIDEILS